jgi:MraZ protein
VGKSGEKMFIGQFEHSIDAKGRVAIPSKFRRDFQGGVVITKGLDGCLFLFSKARWQKMADSIGQLPTTKSSARLYARLLLASAVAEKFDNQGRVIIPGFLKKYADLKNKVVVTGLYDRVEIWDKKAWGKLEDRVDKDAGKIAEELSDLGI